MSLYNYIKPAEHRSQHSSDDRLDRTEVRTLGLSCAAETEKKSVALVCSRTFETEFTRADEDENDHDTEHFDCARILREIVRMLAKS